jgi:hypothetical protein
MKEEIKELIKDLEAINTKFQNQLNEKPDMLWTYKSAKMNEISVNKTVIARLQKIIA